MLILKYTSQIILTPLCPNVAIFQEVTTGSNHSVWNKVALFTIDCNYCACMCVFSMQYYSQQPSYGSAYEI